MEKLNLNKIKLSEKADIKAILKRLRATSITYYNLEEWHKEYFKKKYNALKSRIDKIVLFEWELKNFLRDLKKDFTFDYTNKLTLINKLNELKTY